MHYQNPNPTFCIKPVSNSSVLAPGTSPWGALLPFLLIIAPEDLPGVTAKVLMYNHADVILDFMSCDCS